MAGVGAGREFLDPGGDGVGVVLVGGLLDVVDEVGEDDRAHARYVEGVLVLAGQGVGHAGAVVGEQPGGRDAGVDDGDRFVGLLQAGGESGGPGRVRGGAVAA